MNKAFKYVHFGDSNISWTEYKRKNVRKIVKIKFSEQVQYYNELLDILNTFHLKSRI